MSLAPPNKGLFWRTAAADQPIEVLREEASNLRKAEESMLRRAEAVEAPAILWEGPHSVDVEFPASSKSELDAIRRSVAPTIEGHHFYKACGGRISSAVDMAEQLVEKGCSYEEAETLFKETIETEYLDAGVAVEIEHVKLNGQTLSLGKALIEDFDRNHSVIRFSRVFKKSGVYDGLKIRKAPGDRAVTEARLGEWYLTTKYFSRDGRYKGTYINIGTPIELYPYGIRYVDLEVDVCAWPDGTVERIDAEKFESAVTEGIVTPRLWRIVEVKLQEAVREATR